MDEVKIQSMAILHIRPEFNVVQSNTTNDIGYVSIVHKIKKSSWKLFEPCCEKTGFLHLRKQPLAFVFAT